MMSRIRSVVCGLLTLGAAVVAGGCAGGDTKPQDSVATAWAGRDGTPASPSIEFRERSQGDAARNPAKPEAADSTVAVVDGRPIGRNQVVDLLLRSHGAGVLEQLIGLELAKQAATAKGLSVSEAEVDFEFDLALRRLSDPLASIQAGAFDRAAAEAVLQTVLSERNISREEFLVTLRRNAYLRKLVQSQQVITEEEVRREFSRRFGERVQVRHIQLASAAEAGRVQDRLSAGEDFAELAGRYSANSTSAGKQGLLEPFAADDEDIPAAFRQTAFALNPGQVSHVIRVGEWHHLLRLERKLPAEPRDFEQVRGELERDLRLRVSETAMRVLHERQMKDAVIEVRDPVLREDYERRHRRPK